MRCKQIHQHQRRRANPPRQLSKRSHPVLLLLLKRLQTCQTSRANFPIYKKKCCSKTSSFLEVVKSSNFRHCVFGVRRGVKLRLPRECLPEVVRSGRVLFGPAEDAIAIFGRVHAILFGKIQCIKWPGWRKPLFAGAVTLMVQSVKFLVDI